MYCTTFNTIFKQTCLFIGDHCYAGPDIVQNSTNTAEEQSSPILLDDFPDTLLTPQTKLVQNTDVTTFVQVNYFTTGKKLNRCPVV